MAFIATPNAVRATLLGKVDSQDAFMTLWFLGSSPAGISDLTTLGDFIIDWAASELIPLLSNGYTLDAVNCVAQDTNFAPSVTVSTGLPLAGSVNSPTQAPQVAGVVTFRTANRGRTSRGRNYIPGIPESGLSSPGNMSVGTIAAIKAAYGLLNGYVSPAGYVHVVVSHYHNNEARSVGFPQAVLTYTMDQPLDTQRRRSVGRGS
jgi:hypothetical protein